MTRTAILAAELADFEEDHVSEEYPYVVAAARKQLALMPETCGTCEGRGLQHSNPGSLCNHPCPTCHGSGRVYPQEVVGRIAKAVGEMFLYPDPNNEGNWMGPGIQASRQVAVAVLDALGETE